MCEGSLLVPLAVCFVAAVVGDCLLYLCSSCRSDTMSILSCGVGCFGAGISLAFVAYCVSCASSPTYSYL